MEKTANRLTEKRINYLHDLAGSSRKSSPEHSARYVDMMERFGRRMDITLPPRIKRSYCKKCRIPYGGSARIRLRHRLLYITCTNCGNVRRIPY